MYADDVSNIIVDPSEFETALVNLVINARDAMPEGGSVIVRAENIPDRAQVAISVEDTGVGIPEDIAAKVFDPFFTTKPVGKGTGLGLSQVHGFAHQAGGPSEVKTSWAKAQQLPCACRRRPRHCDPSRNKWLRGSGTVLLVEDNPEVATVSTGLLEQLGYDVRWAADAPAAWQSWKRTASISYSRTS